MYYIGRKGYDLRRHGMRGFILILMVLISQVFFGPLVWIGMGIWLIYAIYTKYKQATKRYKM
jgi:hypothetical protein